MDDVVQLEGVKRAFLIAAETVAQVLEQLLQVRFVVAGHKRDVVTTARFRVPRASRVRPL